MAEEKQEQINQLAKNAKQLNRAATEFKDVLVHSNEQIDGIVEEARATKTSVKKAQQNVTQLTKEVKRDYFCWWLLGDALCFGLFVALFIFCVWGIPPQF